MTPFIISNSMKLQLFPTLLFSPSILSVLLGFPKLPSIATYIIVLYIINN